MPNQQILKQRTSFSPIEIIVLCQNDRDITERFLNTLYKYTHDFSLIMIDNGSTDGSLDFLGKFASDKENMTLVRNDDDLGCVDGRNQGEKISRIFNPISEYICFLDNDQFVSPGWLTRHFYVMKHGYDIVGCEAWLIHPQTLLPIRHNNNLSQEFSYLGCGGMMIKRAVIEDIGMFDSDFEILYFEDPLYCFTAYYAGYKIGWNIKHGIRHEQQSTVASSEEKKRRFLASYEKFKKKWKGHAVPRLKQQHLPTW